MINLFNLLYRRRFIKVEWDNYTQNSLKPIFHGRSHELVPIRLFDLIKGIGSVEPKRVNPTILSSIMDYSYLLERIQRTREFTLKISETRNLLGSEELGKISGFIGIGLSVVVLSYLFDIQTSTISKIKGTSALRPDWSCFLKDNKVLIVEAKGSISLAKSNTQLKHAISQKNSFQGDLKVATATVLYETQPSKMRIVDPPTDGTGHIDENQRKMFRAYHYASVFSFLGDAVLSLYFEKMARRISGTIGKTELNDKALMFEELEYRAPSLWIGDSEFVGHLYGPFEHNHYLFLGVNKEILSYPGFMNFEDYENETSGEIEGNEYLIYSDGILVINIVSIDSFINRYHIESIGVSLDNIALSDIDSIRSSSFKSYVKYLLDKCYQNVEWTKNGLLKINGNDGGKEFYVYHSRNMNDGKASQKILDKLQKYYDLHHSILVTNLRIPKDTFNFEYIDRSDFERIANSKADIDIVKEIFCK